MQAIPNDVDWSATAAWIALVISITGTIAGPILTAKIKNRHQLKMFTLKSNYKEYAQKQRLLRQSISGIGFFLSAPSSIKMKKFSKTFHYAYAYLPEEKWPLLDDFYTSVVNKDYAAARQKQPEIIHLLSESLKEPPQ